MIELQSNALVFSFPEVHPDAQLTVAFLRTLRIPDDEKTYPLPPGLGRFPVRHVDDFAQGVPAPWIEHGGVMLPMYQAEALWLSFFSPQRYPFALRIFTGKVDAITGKELEPGAGLRRGPQNYLVAPDQPWLDGYCVEKGLIRQFVAMPLGAGYSAEEQITGRAEHGGIQIIAHPMTAEAYERIRARQETDFMIREGGLPMAPMALASAGMGLAPGGRMKQEIYRDKHHLEDWDQDHSGRCFVHIANSMVWRQITGEQPPTTPPTAKEYTKAGLPWFDFYSENAAVEGSSILKGLKSVFGMGKAKGDVPLPENESVTPAQVVGLRDGLGKGQVREWRN